jgi:hypothetical protein
MTQPNQHSFTRSQLRDHAFYLEHRKAIDEAARKGAIIDDIPKPSWKGGVPPAPPPPAPEAPPPPPQRAGTDMSHVTGRIETRPSDPWNFIVRGH